MEKVNVTCRLPVEDIAFIDKIAVAMDRDRSYLLKQAVTEFIAIHRWQLDEIDHAIKEADAGLFATDQEVKAAFDELRW